MKKAALLGLLLACAAGAYLLLMSGGDKNAVEATPEAPATASLSESTTERVPKAPPPQPKLDDDPLGTLRLEGQVVDQDMLPIEGATVSVSSNPWRTATSAEDGSFHFEGLLPRVYHLRASKGELVARAASSQLTATSDPIVLKLRKGASARVTVVAAASGKPIAGARVSSAEREELSASTDGEGVATLQGLDHGFQAVRASADGYASRGQLINVATLDSVANARIELDRGAPVSGVVVDSQGKPIQGAKVRAHSAGEFAMGDLADKTSAESDAAGKFTLASVAAGSYRFGAEHDGLPYAQSEIVTVDGASEKGGVEIRFGEAATLRGTVQSTDGNPVPWAEVTISPKSDAPWGFGDSRRATADESGEFEFAGLAKKPMQVLAEGLSASSEIEEVDLSSGNREDLVLILSQAGVIAGTVVDSDDEPVGEVQVQIMPDWTKGGIDREFFLRGRSRARTDAGGRFRFTGLKEGDYLVSLSERGQMAAWSEGSNTKAVVGDENLRLVLEKAGGLKGTVVYDEGGAPEIFTVHVRWKPFPVQANDGSFELAAITGPGTYDITVKGADFADHRISSVKIEAGQLVDLGTVRVKRGRVLSGRVFDGAGRPVAGAKVFVGETIVGDGKHLANDMFSGGALKKGTTDADGHYRVVGISDKTELHVAAEHSELGRSHATKLPKSRDDASADLKLRAFGSAKGKVTKNGKPLSGVQLLATVPGVDMGQIALVIVGEGGSFAFDRLPEGAITFSALSSDGMSSGTLGTTEVTIQAGKESTVQIDVVTGNITLSVNVLGEGDAVIPAAQVFPIAGEVEIKVSAELAQHFAGGSAKSGFFLAKPVEFKEMTPGTYSVCAIPLAAGLDDTEYLQRVNEHKNELDVHCRPLSLKPSPEKQEFTMTIPPASPLPEPENPAN